MVILINGTMNSGKSTVARIIKEKLPKIAHIEKLRQFIEWMSIEESIPYIIKNMVSLTRNFLEGDLNVLISYPVNEEAFDKLENVAKEFDVPMYAFTLSPELGVVTKNRGERELAEWEVKKIKEDYKNNFHKPNFGEVIDNSRQTPQETAEYILNKINEENSQN